LWEWFMEHGPTFGRLLSHAAKVGPTGLFPFFDKTLVGKRTRHGVNF